MLCLRFVVKVIGSCVAGCERRKWWCIVSLYIPFFHPPPSMPLLTNFTFLSLLTRRSNSFCIQQEVGVRVQCNPLHAAKAYAEEIEIPCFSARGTHLVPPAGGEGTVHGKRHYLSQRMPDRSRHLRHHVYDYAADDGAIDQSGSPTNAPSIQAFSCNITTPSKSDLGRSLALSHRLLILVWGEDFATLNDGVATVSPL